MLEKTPLVTVITPSYNSIQTIQNTFESIKNQTYQNIEYILIDGGSTDGTIELAKRYQNDMIANMTIVSEADNGIYDAMNKGIHMAHGVLIGIVNSDDWYELDAVEQIVREYNGDNYQVFYGMQRNYYKDMERTIFIHHHVFLREQMITHPTCFVTKKTYDDFGLFDTQYHSAADYDLMLRFWESGLVKFTPLYQIISNFRMGGMSSGQIGFRENAKLKYRRGYIIHKKYYYLVCKSYLYEMLNKRK